MSGDDLLSRIQGEQIRNLPACVDRSSLTPFTAEPKPIEGWYEFNKLLTRIFDEEAQRLGLSPERFEYSCVNEMYKPDHPIWDTHYLIYDPGPGIMRGILGNLVGEQMKKELGVDLGKMFEETMFSFGEVMFKLPGVDVGGYGNIHTFFNVLNRHLRHHNLAVGYVRQEDDCSFRHGFYDHIGLIEGIPGPGLGSVTAGEVEMYPVREVEENKLYVVDVKGGRLIAAPMASCNWNLNYIEGMEEQDFLKADADEIPVKDRMVDTFHFLNGVTPHYVREQLTDGLSRIRQYLKPKEDTEKPLPPSLK